MFLKPKDGIIVPNPDNNNKPLLPEGERVKYSDYWRRRIKDKDVTEVKQVAKKSKATSKS